MRSRHLFLVVARADNGVIGRGGTLPWRLPADLRHFKRLTTGKPMIMGRRTFDSLPGLLPGRRHIVLTRDRAWSAEGADVAHDEEAALRLANAPEIAIIGGADIFAMFMPRASRIELTEVHAAPDGDTSLAAPDARDWTETAREDHPAAGGLPGYSFVTLLRRPA